MKMYGSLVNRMEEGKQFTNEIKVGTGVTEYFYSDRHAYEVIEVIDQKHITVRAYDHKHIGEPFTNEWELVSNENNPARALEKRGNYWYWTNTVTAEQLKAIPDSQDGLLTKLHLGLAGFDFDKIIEKGKQTKRTRANISIGKAVYHYDYEF